jgi:DNA-binding transcriptional LysR family regulator
MELRHLRYFVAVAEELHFRRAAERLHIAQPAVSEQVRKLENELGVRLFDRTHRNVALTDAGAALLPEAHRVLRQAEAARLAARSASDRPGRVLRIGYVPTALLASIPRTLRRVVATTPNLKTTMEPGPGLGCVEATRRILAGPAVAVMLLTASETDARVFATLRAGAAGLLLENREPAALVRAVRRLGRGGRLRTGRSPRTQPAREVPMLTPKVTEITRGCAHPAKAGQGKASAGSRQRW